MTLAAALSILLWLLIFCLIFGGAWYLLGAFGGSLPAPLQAFLRFVIVVLAVIVLIYAVLQVVGVPTLPRLR